MEKSVLTKETLTPKLLEVSPPPKRSHRISDCLITASVIGGGIIAAAGAYYSTQIHLNDGINIASRGGMVIGNGYAIAGVVDLVQGKKKQGLKRLALGVTVTAVSFIGPRLFRAVQLHIAQLQYKLTQTEKEVQELRARITKMSSEAAEAAVEKQELRYNITGLETQVKGLGTELTTCRRDMVSLEGQTSYLRQNNSFWQTEARDFEHTSKTLTNSVRGLETELTSCGREVVSLQSQAGELEQTTASLRGTVSGLESELSSYKENTDSTVSALRASISQMGAQAKTAAAEYQSATTALTSKFDSLTSTHSQLSLDYAALQARAAGSAKTVKELTGQIEGFTTQVSGLQTTIKTAQTRADELQKVVTRYEVLALQTSNQKPALADMNKQLKSLRTKIAQLSPKQITFGTSALKANEVTKDLAGGNHGLYASQWDMRHEMVDPSLTAGQCTAPDGAARDCAPSWNVIKRIKDWLAEPSSGKDDWYLASNGRTLVTNYNVNPYDAVDALRTKAGTASVILPTSREQIADMDVMMVRRDSESITLFDRLYAERSTDAPPEVALSHIIRADEPYLVSKYFLGSKNKLLTSVLSIVNRKNTDPAGVSFGTIMNPGPSTPITEMDCITFEKLSPFSTQNTWSAGDWFGGPKEVFDGHSCTYGFWGWRPSKTSEPLIENAIKSMLKLVVGA